MIPEYVRLPDGAGRRIRRRLIRHILLHLLLGVAVLIGGLLITVWWPPAELDAEFWISGWAIIPVWTGTIMVAVKACWLPSTVRGDSLRVREMIRLDRGCRAYWLAALVTAGLVTIVLAVACVRALHEPGRLLSALYHLLPFSIPAVSAMFASTNYLTLHRQLLSAGRAVLPLDDHAAHPQIPPDASESAALDRLAANTVRANDSRTAEGRDEHDSCALRRR